MIQAPAPPATGKRGRARVKGQRLGDPAQIADSAKQGAWRQVSVAGRGDALVLVVNGLWYSVFGPRAVQVVIVREPGDTEGCRIALIATDTQASPADLIGRYADRWSIEVCFQDAKHMTGVGEARNRVQRAVERTVPFGFLAQTSAVAWYALHGDPAADVRRRRLSAPCYRQKRDPSMLDLLASLRRELIRGEFLAQAGRGRRQQETSGPAWLPQPAAA